MDSIMVITTLNNYDATGNTLGTELARDTVYVKHNSFDPFTTPLPNIAVQSTFDVPVTVTSEYMVTMTTPTDDSLKIIANDFNTNDGQGDNMGYALYDNVNYPTYYGWYDMIADFAADYDFLISPKVKYSQYDTLIIEDTVICPTNDLFCLNYIQSGVNFNKQYNANYSSPYASVSMAWGDGNTTLDTAFACHFYNTTGMHTVQLKDTLSLWNYSAPDCPIEITKTIEVLDTIQVDFTYTLTGNTANFTTIATGVDSVWWDFGDASTGNNQLNPTHTYSGPGNYTVWLYSYNECMTRTVIKTITIKTSGINNTTVSTPQFYPNPASSQLKFEGEILQLKVINIAGETVYSNKNVHQNFLLDVSTFSNGTYFVSIENSNDTYTKKLVIRH
ncbi:T9SS type A sorting domain-containing protein [Putridiphycobacter roseus]